MPRKADARFTTSAKKILGISFKKSKWVDAALIHPSYRNETACPKLENFDRLEFFGDAILNFVICRKLYHMFPDADEGMLSRLRSILVSKKILFRITKETKLIKKIRLGKSLSQQEEFSKIKIFSDAFEALIGALYFDRGLVTTEKFILRHFRPYLDAKRLFRLDPNPKSTLQELAQKRWQKLPQYINEITPEGAKTIVSITPSRKATARARTRRQSEEKAARFLIRKIRQEVVRFSKRKSSGKKLRKTF